jgi:hypothetical protein
LSVWAPKIAAKTSIQGNHDRRPLPAVFLDKMGNRGRIDERLIGQHYESRGGIRTFRPRCQAVA